MKLGHAAQQSQLQSKTIRYHEEIHLIKPARSSNDHRDYSQGDVHRLKFLQQSRALAQNCLGDNGPDCPIIDDLSGKNHQ